MMNPLLWLFNMVIELVIWIVIASAIVSWLVAFGVINMRNNVVRMIVDTLYRVTEPMLRPIRRFMPNLGGVDISPVVLLVALYFLRYLVNYTFYSSFY
jgi:YggT family protein